MSASKKSLCYWLVIPAVVLLLWCGSYLAVRYSLGKRVLSMSVPCYGISLESMGSWAEPACRVANVIYFPLKLADYGITGLTVVFTDETYL